MSLLDILRVAGRYLVPGTPTLLLLGTVGGVVLVLIPGRTRRWGGRWLAGLFLVYGALSLQVTSDLLHASLAVEGPRLQAPTDAPGLHTVVVLSNGAGITRADGRVVWIVNVLSEANAAEGARLYRALDHPVVVASGGRPLGSGDGPAESAALAVSLERLGVPAGRILQESHSRTTRDQAVNVGALLRRRGETRFVLVTVPEHMRRAAAAFRVLGLDPVPSPSSLHWGDPQWWHPNAGALRGSAGVLHEYGALLLYWWKGWI